MIQRIRIILIQLGKVLPFILCLISLISYCESCYALIMQDYVMWGNDVILNKPISWFIGNYFEYNLQMLFVIAIISFAIRTCIYNKLAILYLALNLYEKSYFSNHIYENNIYYIVAIINSLICAFFYYKGIKILRK